MEMDLWKEKLGKYETIINEQKTYINDLNFNVNKLKNNELEIRQKYDYEISHLRSENEELSRKVDRLQR